MTRIAVLIPGAEDRRNDRSSQQSRLIRSKGREIDPWGEGVRTDGGVIVLVAVTLAAFRVNTTTLFPYTSALTITDPSMTVISRIVERGALWGTARVGSSYRFDQPAGLVALCRFSVLVLRRGLQDYDPYERCYATSALATAGDRDEIVGDGLGSRGTTVEAFTRKAKQVCARRKLGRGNRPA